MFAMRWEALDGTPFQGWLRLGDRAGNFDLLQFDSKTELLSVGDGHGRIYQLALPTGKVREANLTDQEFSELKLHLRRLEDWKNAPELSREKARAFYFRLIRERSGPGKEEVLFDLDGSTLPPERRATWAEDKAKARASGTLLLAVVADGKTVIAQYPLRPDPMPDQMTRNLLDSDWEEIALLDATNMFRNRNPQKH